MLEKDTPKEISETASPTPEVKPARTIPNGGLQAWLQVVGAFFLYFNTWGECPSTRRRTRDVHNQRDIY